MARRIKRITGGEAGLVEPRQVEARFRMMIFSGRQRSQGRMWLLCLSGRRMDKMPSTLSVKRIDVWSEVIAVLKSRSIRHRSEIYRVSGPPDD